MLQIRIMNNTFPRRVLRVLYYPRRATANLISVLYREGNFREALSIEFYTGAYKNSNGVIRALPSFPNRRESNRRETELKAEGPV